jgi:sugar phosphate isomerase/epimerase
MYIPLPKSYKKAYPFKLGTTSFIYPDNYVPNVKMLGPYLDEIELLMFESAAESLPSKQEIQSLSRLGEEFDLTYNVHLPVDVPLTDHNPSAARESAEAIQRVIDLAAPLSPSTYTLHLHYDEDSRDKASVEKWQETAYQNVSQLLDTGISPDIISIETLDYPFEWAEKIITDFNLSVCIDMGHLIIYGFDPEAVFDQYYHKISIIHLHGVEKGRDHIALDRLPLEHMNIVIKILRRFTGVVSLEVFSYKNLTASLAFLEKCWKEP